MNHTIFKQHNDQQAGVWLYAKKKHYRLMFAVRVLLSVWRKSEEVHCVFYEFRKNRGAEVLHEARSGREEQRVMWDSEIVVRSGIGVTDGLKVGMEGIRDLL